MSKWLKADCVAGDAYAEKDSLGLVVGSGFSVELDVIVPAATLAAIFAAFGAGAVTADWFTLTSLANGHDGVFGFDTSGIPTWQFTADHSPGNGGSLTGDVAFHLKYASVWNAGTLQSDITVSVDGSPILTYSTVAFGGAADTVDVLRVGGVESDGLAGEIYYADNVVVKNGVGTTVFSDDFETGTFAAWSSHTAGTSIVDISAADFTISADPSTVTFTTPGIATVTINVGQVNDSEDVDLVLDTSGLPGDITASLDASTVTTPGSATLTITAAAGASCDSYDIIVTGDDGTNTHSVTVHVVIDGTEATYDETGGPAQAGSDMSQGGGTIDSGNMVVHRGDLYWAWTEQGPASGPYVAKWNGVDWEIVADAPVFGEVANTTRPKLATDGTNLYFAYLAHRAASWPDCHDPGGPTRITAAPFSAIVWTFNGTAWTNLGGLGCGCVFNDASYGDEFSAGDSASLALELSASAHETGACYVAFFEEGYEGTDSATYPASRHLTLAGFGTSTLGVVGFDSLLFEPDRPTDPHTGKCLGSTNFAPQIFSMRLVGSGDVLTLYVQELAYDPLTSGFWTIIQVWQRAGFLPNVTLATDFPSTAPGTLIGYQLPLISSNDVGVKRWVGVARPTTFFSHVDVVRQTNEHTPGTFGFTDGIVDGSADSIFGDFNKLIGEASGNLWAVDTNDSGNILLLANRCGVVSWANFTGGSFASGIPYSGDPVIFDDAFWLSGGSGHGNVRAFRVPICRGCGDCCGLIFGPPVFRNTFKAGTTAPGEAPETGGSDPVFDPSFHFPAGDNPAETVLGGDGMQLTGTFKAGY